MEMAFCYSGKPEVMDLLLKKSTSGMNAVNKAGRTSLHVAACKQHADCVRVLLKYRCDVNIQVTYHLCISTIYVF